MSVAVVRNDRHLDRMLSYISLMSGQKHDKQMLEARQKAQMETLQTQFMYQKKIDEVNNLFKSGESAKDRLHDFEVQMKGWDFDLKQSQFDKEHDRKLLALKDIYQQGRDRQKFEYEKKEIELKAKKNKMNPEVQAHALWLQADTKRLNALAKTEEQYGSTLARSQIAKNSLSSFMNQLKSLSTLAGYKKRSDPDEASALFALRDGQIASLFPGGDPNEVTQDSLQRGYKARDQQERLMEAFDKLDSMKEFDTTEGGLPLDDDDIGNAKSLLQGIQGRLDPSSNAPISDADEHFADYVTSNISGLKDLDSILLEADTAFWGSNSISVQDVLSSGKYSFDDLVNMPSKSAPGQTIGEELLELSKKQGKSGNKLRAALQAAYKTRPQKKNEPAVHNVNRQQLTSTDLPAPQNAAERNALPKGTKYIAPNGKVMIKDD